MIPQTDPKAAYLAQKPEIDAAVLRVLESGWYILGKEVEAFEREFATFAESAGAVGVANGTDALMIGLRALGVGAGDRVLTVSHTAVATVAAIELIGAVPVLIDIDAATYTMNVSALQSALLMPGAKAKAIVPVHLYGHPAPMNEIMDLAKQHGIAVLEDCSQAHGARLQGVQVGGFGAAAAFSLYPTKNLGAIGDGGILTTAAPEIAERMKALREYGWRQRYISDIAGQNSRLDELQAAILRVKLGRLHDDNEARRKVAARYDRELAGLPFVLPRVASGARHVYHQYVIRSRRRDELKEFLRTRGIATNVHYPAPVHLQPAYRDRVACGPGGLAETEAAARTVLSLPMYPQLAEEQVARVIAALHDAAKAGFN